MKKFGILTLLSISFLAINPSSYAKNSLNQPSCDWQLRQLTFEKFKIKGLSTSQLQAELGDNEGGNQSIRIFSQDKTGINDGATLGWLKLDKMNYKLYDITNDDLHPKLLKVNQKQVKNFVNQCLK